LEGELGKKNETIFHSPHLEYTL